MASNLNKLQLKDEPVLRTNHFNIFTFLGDFGIWVFIVVMALIEFLPVSWLFSNSLRDPKVAYVLPPSFWPTDFQWVNYLNVINSPQIKFLLFPSLASLWTTASWNREIFLSPCRVVR